MYNFFIMKKIIFGFTGLISSGKGTAAAYLEKKYGASTYRFSTTLRDLLDLLYLPHTRDNLQDISTILRKQFGEDLLAKTMARNVESDKKNIIVVEGIRRLADIDYLAKLPGFVLVEIKADAKIRYERLTKRNENQDDKEKTFAEFLADHEKEAENSIPEVISHATEHVDNTGDFATLYKQLDELVVKYQD
jgi:dephospho-CoA kinase